MSPNPLHIPEPCGQHFSTMPRCGNTAFCALCQKNVTDLSRKNISEVHVFVAQNPGACVWVQSRHLSQNRRVRFINRFEVFLQRFKVPALSSLVVGMLLLVSGCHPRKTVSRTMGAPRFLKQQQILNEEHSK